jgi:hypothetical protein
MRSIVTARLWTPAVATIVSVIVGFGTAVALAQDMPGAMYPGMMGRGATTCRMDQYVDGQLAYLKTVLKITETQTPQWNVFADAFRADREKSALLCKEAMEQARAVKSASLLDSLTLVEDQLAERLDSLRALKAAMQPLYASLSKDQKKTADEVMKGGQNF